MFETTNQHIIAYYSMIIDTRWTSSFRTWLDGSNTLHMLSWWCLQCREYLPVEKSSKSSLAEILAQFRVPAIIFPPQSQASFRHHSGLLKSSRTKYVDRTLLLILEFLWYVWICLNNFGYHHQRYPETSKVSIGLQASAVSSCSALRSDWSLGCGTRKSLDSTGCGDGRLGKRSLEAARMAPKKWQEHRLWLNTLRQGWTKIQDIYTVYK